MAVVPLPPWRTGAAVMCTELLRALAARGHRIHALAPITPEATLPGDASSAPGGKVDVSWFPVPRFAGFDDSVSDEYRRREAHHIQEWLEGCIRRERPDIMLVGRGAYALHAPLVARTAGIPCVVIVHGGPVASGASDPSWNRIVAALTSVDLVVTPARHWAATLRGLGLSRVAVIPNPVDAKRFAPRPPDEALARRLDLPADRVVVLHASNLQDVKRPMDLVASAERALRREPRLVYVITGDGPHLAGMVSACDGLGLTERFRFVGWVEHARMPTFLSLADIVLMTSEQECQAMIYLEAQASGRLLLASDVPGAREVVDDGTTGALFRTGDIDDLTDQIVTIASRPAWRAAVGRKARRRVAAHALPAIAARYERMLEGMATAATRSHRRRAPTERAKPSDEASSRFGDR